MMNLVQRLRYFFRGRANALLNELDNPEEQLAVIVDELDDQVEDLQRAVAGALADEKRLRLELEDQLARAGEWENRAMLALDEEKDEALAREALLKKDECENHCLAVQKRWDAQRAAAEQLKVSLRRARERVAEAKRQHTLLVAQYKSAETKRRIHESLSASNGDSPLVAMERLAERIRKIEAETDANLELNGEAVDRDLEDKFVGLEKRRRGDQALEMLKARIRERHQLQPPAAGNRLDRIEALKAKLEGN